MTITPTYYTHNRTKPIAGSGTFGYSYEEKAGYKQQPVEDPTLPLAYNRFMLDSKLLTYAPSVRAGYLGFRDTRTTVLHDMVNGNTQKQKEQAFNKAYSKLVSEMHDTVSLGLALAEAREAADMIEHRADHLRTGWLALVQGNFLKFLKTFSLRPKAHHVGRKWIRPQQAASIWLEYWFGWAPFVSDIYSALEALEAPYPEGFVEGSGKVIKTYNLSTSSSHYFYGYKTVHKATIVVYCKVGCRVRIDNPLLYRLNQFGVLNPAVVLWGRKPLSFLVDWFLPVSQFLGSFTDFVGLHRDREYTTYYQKGSEEYLNVGTGTESAGGVSETRTTGLYMTRGTAIGTPFFTLKEFRGLSVSRAATAISLLVGAFSPRFVNREANWS